MWRDICEDLGINWAETKFVLWEFDNIKALVDVFIDFLNKAYNFIFEYYWLWFLFAIAFVFAGLNVLSRAFRVSRL